MLYFPGPAIITVKKQVRKRKAVCPSPNISQLCALQTATAIAMINGMDAKRVNKPTRSNMAHENSAHIISAYDISPPSPMKFINSEAFSE